MNPSNKFTMATLPAEMIFEIPLYQRMYEWKDENVRRLMEDLKKASSKNAPYYIGMFTVSQKEGRHFLVDGQQRLTVLVLMALEFGWKDFLKLNDKNEITRLKFFARPKDTQYLKDVFLDTANPDYRNRNMESALGVIREFAANDTERKLENFIWANLTFFVSELPREYSPEDLNQYFERMNASGRSLENHEILKVELLAQSSPEKREEYTKIWNTVSVMDKQIVRQKEKETVEEFEKQRVSALRDAAEAMRYLYDADGAKVNAKICAIPASSVNPENPPHSVTGERAIVAFPEFLLVALWLTLSDEQHEAMKFSFDSAHLLKTFEQADFKVDDFFTKLLQVRILFDYAVIRLGSENGRTSYGLEMGEDPNLVQLQSMLYVSTATHLWVPEFLKVLLEKGTVPTEADAVTALETIIAKREQARPLDVSQLSYPACQHYWFYKLEYLLWKMVATKDGTLEINLTSEEKAAVLAYRFQAGLTVEHFHPQSDDGAWGDEAKHCFGNLALITSTANTKLGKDTLGGKAEHLQRRVKEKTLESIKLLLMCKQCDSRDENWKPGLAQEHGKNVMEILKPKNSQEDAPVSDL